MESEKCEARTDLPWSSEGAVIRFADGRRYHVGPRLSMRIRRGHHLSPRASVLSILDRVVSLCARERKNS